MWFLFESYQFTYTLRTLSMNRRTFLHVSTQLAGGALLSTSWPNPSRDSNPLPEWKGFNLLDFFSPVPGSIKNKTTSLHLQWMADWGFDFIRLPMAYPHYLNFDRQRPIRPEDVRNIDERTTDQIEELVFQAHRYGLHVSLNLHRAPGYCINAGFEEPYHLWKDQAALEDFCFHWDFWAKRFRSVSASKISFDLLNEPAMRDDMNDQHAKNGPVPGATYRAVAEAATRAIRAHNPNNLVIADGNNVGNTVVPELMDLDIAQSCRGYNPGSISHYKAPWVVKDIDTMPMPKWPGQVGDRYLSRDLLETYYKPWIELSQQGVGVHCGECGCYNKTPHEVFLSWFDDVLDILHLHHIGFALWEFRGSFGVLDSGRADVAYVDWYGHKLDKKLLNLLRKNI